MHEVVPIVVTMAVRIVMIISTTRFKVKFFIFSYNFLCFVFYDNYDNMDNFCYAQVLSMGDCKKCCPLLSKLSLINYHHVVVISPKASRAVANSSLFTLHFSLY